MVVLDVFFLFSAQILLAAFEVSSCSLLANARLLPLFTQDTTR